MAYKIRRAAVLGAGTMGSRLAAQLANAGIPSYLLDIAPAELTEEERRKGLPLESGSVRNRIVAQGWKTALSGRPPALFSPEVAGLVTLGNLTDNLPWLADVDWIIEAVTENLATKRSLLERIEQFRKPGTIVSSNTSAIPIHELGAGLSDDFRKHFLGTHFFNPPRYLKLLEIVPGAETCPDLVRFMVRFGEDVLGKGAILCKDTPTFIANRIGTYGGCVALSAMLEEGLTIEEADQLTGPALSRPKSATFRTFDVVGLDTFANVVGHLHTVLADERETFTLPLFVQSMLANKWLGDKTGQGFYKRVRGNGQDAFYYLDYNTLEYRPLQQPRISILERTARLDSRRRVRALVSGKGREGRFLWKLLSSTICYAASKIPEISDDIVNVDHAMNWGFLHKLGPFQIWDALGVPATAERLQREGRPVPPLVQSLLEAGGKSFYKKRAGRTFFFDAGTRSLVKQPEAEGLIVLSSLKDRKKTVLENASASLLDIGDGVVCLEFHTKMNTIDADVLQLANQALDQVEQNFEGMVIASEGEHFSAGANLFAALSIIREGRWDVLDKAIRNFQDTNMRFRYSEKPVVAAPHGMTLGGGCEIALHSDRVHSAAELYMGFAETAVGLIPGAGGCKEMVLRAADEAGSDSDIMLLPRIRKAFETIAMAKISTSASEARQLGLLTGNDHSSMNSDRRIQLAKDDVLALVREAYRPSRPRTDIPVLGQPGLATLKMALYLMRQGGYITEYDSLVGTHLAKVLTGGACLGVTKVSEQYLLDLEREAFLSLCGEPKTQERIEHMLKQGKALRN